MPAEPVAPELPEGPPEWAERLHELAEKTSRAQARLSVRLEDLESKLEGGFGDLRIGLKAAAKVGSDSLRWDELLDAMDALEGSSRTPPAQREQQFLRLLDRIETRAAQKFSDVELEGNPPGVILRAIDFR